MDTNTYNAVKGVFDQQGVPEYVWFPIMQFESGGDPNAVGDSGVSIGLFQLNTAGGQGSGYNKEYLKNPTINAEIASRAIAPAYFAVKDRYTPQSMAGQVAIRSGHPGGSISHPLQGRQSTAAVSRLDALSRSFVAGQSALQKALPPNPLDNLTFGSGSLNPLEGLGKQLGGVNDFFVGLNEALSKFDPIAALLVLAGAFLLFLVIASLVVEKTAPVAVPIAKAAITKGAL